jgi:hypothetical protein
MNPQVGDLRTVTQRFDGEQWVLCLQSMLSRELSDEEIMKEAEKDKYWDYEDFDFMKFARAILKKASEK